MRTWLGLGEAHEEKATTRRYGPFHRDDADDLMPMTQASLGFVLRQNNRKLRRTTKLFLHVTLVSPLAR